MSDESIKRLQSIMAKMSNVKQTEDEEKDVEDEQEEMQSKIERGIHVEMEHTGDRQVAEKIARDHLAEDDDYYEKLAKMEGTKQAKVEEPENEEEEESEDDKAKRGAYKKQKKYKGSKLLEVVGKISKEKK